MWIEEHEWAGYRWYVARRWERSPVGYLRHTRYCRRRYIEGLDSGHYTMDDVELALFGSVTPPKPPPITPPPVVIPPTKPPIKPRH